MLFSEPGFSTFTSELNFVFDLPGNNKGNLKLLNESGQVARVFFSEYELQRGENKYSTEVSDLPEGFYLGVFDVDGKYYTNRLIKALRGSRGGDDEETLKKGASRFEEMEQKLKRSQKPKSK